MKTPKSNGKEITQKQFIASLNKGLDCYMKKPKSWQKLHFWWEDEEHWFMNKAHDMRVKGEGVQIENSTWITAKQLTEFLDYYERQGYKYYTNE